MPSMYFTLTVHLSPERSHFKCSERLSCYHTGRYRFKQRKVVEQRGHNVGSGHVVPWARYVRRGRAAEGIR